MVFRREVSTRFCRSLLAAALVMGAALGLPASAPDAAEGHYPLQSLGLYTQFEERGQPFNYWPGWVIQNFDQYDPAVGHLVSDEVSLQLDKMNAMGVNKITYELRTANRSCGPGCNTTFPSCRIPSALGLDWPQPTPKELTNLKSFFDLVTSKGMRINLSLTNTHMTVSATSDSKAWLGAIIQTVKGHPALNLLLFAGDAQIVAINGSNIPNACGQEAEAPLWDGPSSYAARYLEWVIPYAMSFGMPPEQLSSEAIVGDFLTDSMPAGGWKTTDHHLWKPIGVLKAVFDSVNIRPRSAAMLSHSTNTANASRRTCPPATTSARMSGRTRPLVTSRPW